MIFVGSAYDGGKTWSDKVPEGFNLITDPDSSSPIGK